jgi:hypothetical protein
MTDELLKSLATYGPGGLMSVITIIALIAVWRYFTNLNKRLMDDFLQRTDKFTEVMEKSNVNATLNTEVLKESRAMMQSINMNLIELKAKQE